VTVVLALLQMALGIGLGQVIPRLALHGWRSAALNTFIGNPWSFYLEWTGFHTLMRALAATSGLALPRSFDRPFFRPNLSEYWAHWNITATSVFRDYLFYNRWGRRAANVYVNVMILFMCVALWHGATIYWVIFGLIQGTGFASFMWYRRRPISARWRARAPRWTGVAATYVFVCLSWAIPALIVRHLGRLR
jgi:D-alanyl-lipoteichoic acid acyltransferase DltB (MBOAT superfamily)